MSDWRLKSDRVELGVHRQGGMLGPVRFGTERGWLSPMHVAPWAREPGAAAEPMLQNLQGDFFCAPFGDSDLLPEETRTHGGTANGAWRLLESRDDRLLLEAAEPVQGATVTKELTVRRGHPVVYQEHRLSGGEGSVPVGHHAMLRVPEGDRLRLSFAAHAWAGTPPRPVEPDPARGRSRLAYPQRIDDLRRALTASGETVDLTTYPALDDGEDLLMLVTDPGLAVAWSTATAVEGRWIWFALRPNDVLRNTVLWLSNGGRYYPPFASRHRRVIGIEETTSYFHLGHRASAEPNALGRLDYPTAVELRPGGVVTTRYAFGAVAAPDGFERVESLRLEPGRVVLTDGRGAEASAPFDTGFVA